MVFMKYYKLILTLALTLAVFIGLNSKFGSIPPIGKFLSPNNGFWQNENDENLSTTIQIDGLKNEVTVHYDQHLIPHVFAQNDTDLYRAQGYLTAKHRLWQLEFQTFAAGGRLAEILGDQALDYDRQERRRGMDYGAENSLKKMQEDPETLGYIEAYRDGVNSYINQLQPKDYPV